MPGLKSEVGRVLGERVVRVVPLGGGQVGRVARCWLASGDQVVAKTSPGGGLDVEAGMLRHLAEHSSLPQPEVVHASAALLIEEFVESDGIWSDEAERHAGELLSDLHRLRAERFGFEGPTMIGPLRLENGWDASWPHFYAEGRLRPLADAADRRGALPEALHRRVDQLAATLPERYDHEPAPALVHGDVWSGNVLVGAGRVVAFLDPSVHYADREVELAFIDLFHTFGRAFYRAYEARTPIEPGYRAWRRDLYQVAPLLVHVALFGRGYLGALRDRLDRLDV